MKSYMNAIGTANPPHRISQTDIAQFMAGATQLDEREKRKLSVLYRTTGIQYRHTVLADYQNDPEDYTFYPNTPDLEPFPTIGPRMDLYRQYALPLSMEAVKNCAEMYPGFQFSKVTHLITVSCTGMYAPGIDIELIEQLNMPTSVQRTAINFMGCYGAFNGLKAADAICRSNPDACVLVVCVELCTIHFQKKKTEDHLLANSLFADGAAAVIVEGQPGPVISVSMESFYCDLALAGKKEMTWDISNFGFEMTLSSYIPDLIKGGIRQLTDKLLRKMKTRIRDIDLFAIHPGGRRILEVIEEQLGMEREDNRYAYRVLKEYGNMSSPTVLFVLKELWKDLRVGDAGKNILSFAFGPGLTMESMVLQVWHGD